ncbi:type II secretion system F family protein [Salinibacterium sp. SYSU T00001]|uniref:type II secretion system F family protein n=1 Tax=Homoserinimonas sedimenticola TaxID=2986805 RepID=UPI002235E0B4|nr:type II secretion system F family protein [Salinibacterium sedimenticola]MCW4385334.1 type II secretion system F family protein [Salinibacterium sedimenticola]
MATATREFAYRGRDAAGKVVKGRLEGASEGAVTSKLRAMNVTPLSIEEATGGTGLQKELSIPGMEKGVGLKDLAIMARQMATMTSSGLSLIRTLTILSEQTENKTLGRTLAIVQSDVEAGFALSAAMAKHPKHFPPLLINLVRAGEAGGFLEDTLVSIAENYENEVKLRATIKSALTYPIAVLCIAFVAVIGMLIFIVPVFETMFADLGGDLPLPTQFLVLLSKNMVWAGPLGLVLLVIFVFWWRANKNTERVRNVVDPLKLKIPVFGPLFAKVAIARFSRNFATMMGAGVPILQSLNIVGEASGNAVIEGALKKVADSVRSGKSVAGPLALEPVFPSMVTQMIAVGEDSGALETMLNKIADFYDQEVEATAEQLTALIEPLMIGIIGLVVGGMIVALYLPIFSIFEQIQ